MQWFGGTLGSHTLHPVSSTWSRKLSCGRLWTAGAANRVSLATAEVGPLFGAVIGSHTVSPERLSAWLSGEWRSGPPSWAGNYAVLVASGGEATVFADPVHALPLHYREVDGAVAWASSSRALSGITRSGVDPVWVSGLLLAPPEAHGTHRSAFPDVRTVPPGHSLRVSGGGRARVSRWWSRPRVTRRVEASDRFRAALEEAVAVRTAQAGHLSCDLSGGLDSTTLCLLASAGRRGLTAWTVHPASRLRGADLDHARNALSGRPHVRHALLPMTDVELPYGGLDRLPPTDEPAPATITRNRHVLAYQRISAFGSTLHMTGDGGDALLMQSPELVLRLAAGGRVLRALRDLQGWAKLDRGSPLRLLPGAVGAGRPTFPRWSTAKARELAGPREGRRIRDLLRTDAELAALSGIGRTAHADTQFAEPFGVRLESPFLDRNVVESAMAFRVRDRGSPWRYKPQLTEAMGDVLPDGVAQRRTKGGTDADHHLGLRAHLPEVSALLSDGWLAGHGLVDVEVLLAELRSAATGRRVSWGMLEPVVAAEAWVRTVEAGPPVRWTRVAACSGVKG